MDQDTRDEYVKETIIGITAASISIVAIVTVAEGGGSAAFADAILALLLALTAPFVLIPSAPWLVAVVAVAGFAVYKQYRHVPPRFMRYLVGAEVVLWIFGGLQLIGRFAVS